MYRFTSKIEFYFHSRHRGYVLLPGMIAFSVILLALTAMFLNPVHSTYSLVRQRYQMHSAKHLAEAACAKALKEIDKNGADFEGEGEISLFSGAAEWHVKKLSDKRLKVVTLGKPDIPSGVKSMVTIELLVSVSKNGNSSRSLEVISKNTNYIEEKK